MNRPVTSQHGISLIELVVSIVIMAICISAIMLFTGDPTRRSADPLIREQANAIAQAYIEEINQKQFCDPDWDHDGVPPNTTECPVNCVTSACNSCKAMGTGWTVETRATYDDVCDYSAIAGEAPTTQGGTAVNNLDQYNVSVSVDDGAGVTIGTAGNILSGNSGQAVLVEVTVTHPGLDNAVIMSTYRTNF